MQLVIQPNLLVTCESALVAFRALCESGGGTYLRKLFPIGFILKFLKMARLCASNRLV